MAKLVIIFIILLFTACEKPVYLPENRKKDDGNKCGCDTISSPKSINHNIPKIVSPLQNPKPRSE